MSVNMARVAIISVHTSPLAKLGGKDSGGMNVYIKELSRELGRRGYLVDVFTRCQNPCQQQIIEFGENARVIHLEAGENGHIIKEILYQHIPEFVCNMRRFKEADGLDYDILHSHYWLSGWAAGFLQRLHDLPHVATFHTLGKMKNRSRFGEQETELRIVTEKEIAVTAHKVIATSTYEKDQIVQLYEVPPDRIEVIPCGVDLDYFRPMNRCEARRKLGITDAKMVLFVGRLEPLKGLDLLLKAVSQLEDESGLRLLVVGGDSGSETEVNRLRNLAWELGIEDRVTFWGAVEHHILPLFYNAANVCIIPSYYESFGMVAAESQACGTPVIASRVGGLQSIVRDGETGFLIPWHCPEPFAERLEILLYNEALNWNFGIAARASVEDLGWPNVASQIAVLYQGLIQQRLREKVRP